MNILITGGAGYLGSVLVRKLQRLHKIRVLDNLMYGQNSLEDVDCELIRGDIRYQPHVINAVRGMDAVIHLAGFVGDELCGLDPSLTAGQNYFATVMLAEAAEYYHVRKFVFASSCSVYGKAEGLMDENSPTNPLSLYARDKLASEAEILRLSERLSVTILRQATLFGPSPRPRYDLVLNTMTARAVKEGGITVYGGSQYRPLLHVEDSAAAFEWALTQPPSTVYNVGAENVKIVELAERVARVTGARLDMTGSIEDQRSYNVDWTKAARAGWKARKTVEQGIREVAKQVKGLNYQDPKYSNFRHITNLIME